MHYVANYINGNINQEHTKRGLMRITHSFGKLRLGKEIGEDVQFLLANKRGGFCGFSAVPTSRYQGLYFEHNWILHKSLETIELINAPEIKDIINKLIEERKYNVVINLEKVSYIDSSGIGALISSLSNLKKYQGGLKIINVFASVRKVFELTKLTSFFEIFSSEEEAINSFS